MKEKLKNILCLILVVSLTLNLITLGGVNDSQGNGSQSTGNLVGRQYDTVSGNIKDNYLIRVSYYEDNQMKNVTDVALSQTAADKANRDTTFFSSRRLNRQQYLENGTSSLSITNLTSNSVFDSTPGIKVYDLTTLLPGDGSTSLEDFFQPDNDGLNQPSYDNYIVPLYETIYGENQQIIPNNYEEFKDKNAYFIFEPVIIILGSAVTGALSNRPELSPLANNYFCLTSYEMGCLNKTYNNYFTIWDPIIAANLHSYLYCSKDFELGGQTYNAATTRDGKSSKVTTDDLLNTAGGFGYISARDLSPITVTVFDKTLSSQTLQRPGVYSLPWRMTYSAGSSPTLECVYEGIDGYHYGYTNTIEVDGITYNNQDSGAWTFSNIQENHVITFYYDKPSPQPDPADIPKYNITYQEALDNQSPTLLQTVEVNLGDSHTYTYQLPDTYIYDGYTSTANAGSTTSLTATHSNIQSNITVTFKAHKEEAVAMDPPEGTLTAELTMTVSPYQYTVGNQKTSIFQLSVETNVPSSSIVSYEYSMTNSKDKLSVKTDGPLDWVSMDHLTLVDSPPSGISYGQPLLNRQVRFKATSDGTENFYGIVKVTDEFGRTATTTAQCQITVGEVKTNDITPKLRLTVDPEIVEAGVSTEVTFTIDSSGTKSDFPITDYAYDSTDIKKISEADGHETIQLKRTVTLTNPKSYTVYQSVEYGAGKWTDEIQDTVSIGVREAPHILKAKLKVTADTTHVSKGEATPINFKYDASESLSSAGIVSYTFTCKELESFDKISNPIPTFTKTLTVNKRTTYEVTLTIVDAKGETDTTTAHISISPESWSIDARLTLSTDIDELISGRDTPVTFTLDGSESSATYDIVDYTFKSELLGDTSGMDSSPNITKTLNQSSYIDYSVTLTITDSKGHTDSVTRKIRIFAYPVRVNPYLVVSANKSVLVAGKPTETRFCFDGHRSTASLPIATYRFICPELNYDYTSDEGTVYTEVPDLTLTEPGTYNVTLIVTDIEGNTGQTTDSLTIGIKEPEILPHLFGWVISNSQIQTNNDTHSFTYSYRSGGKEVSSKVTYSQTDSFSVTLTQEDISNGYYSVKYRIVSAECSRVINTSIAKFIFHYQDKDVDKKLDAGLDYITIKYPIPKLDMAAGETYDNSEAHIFSVDVYGANGVMKTAYWMPKVTLIRAADPPSVKVTIDPKDYYLSDTVKPVTNIYANSNDYLITRRFYSIISKTSGAVVVEGEGIVPDDILLDATQYTEQKSYLVTQYLTYTDTDGISHTVSDSDYFNVLKTTLIASLDITMTLADNKLRRIDNSLQGDGKQYKQINISLGNSSSKNPITFYEFTITGIKNPSLIHHTSLTFTNPSIVVKQESPTLTLRFDEYGTYVVEGKIYTDNQVSYPAYALMTISQDRLPVITGFQIDGAAYDSSLNQLATYRNFNNQLANKLIISPNYRALDDDPIVPESIILTSNSTIPTVTEDAPNYYTGCKTYQSLIECTTDNHFGIYQYTLSLREEPIIPDYRPDLWATPDRTVTRSTDLIHLLNTAPTVKLEASIKSLLEVVVVSIGEPYNSFDYALLNDLDCIVYIMDNGLKKRLN